MSVSVVISFVIAGVLVNALLVSTILLAAPFAFSAISFTSFAALLAGVSASALASDTPINLFIHSGVLSTTFFIASFILLIRRIISPKVSKTGCNNRPIVFNPHVASSIVFANNCRVSSVIVNPF